jgi:hypothetical protein
LQELKEQRDVPIRQLEKDQAKIATLQAALDKKTYDRPKFRKGMREEVWQNAVKDAQEKGDGVVRSPSGTEIKPGDPWVMGHKQKYEFWKHQRSAAERGITRTQFTEEYNKANHYRPETEADSSSHAYEDKTDAYLGY